MSLREASLWVLGLIVLAGLLLLGIYTPYLTWYKDAGAGQSNLVSNSSITESSW